MTKSEIIDFLSRSSGINKKKIIYIVNTFLSNIKENVQKDNLVEIRGFGTFYKVEKKARKVYSPIAGKTIDVQAKCSLGFRPSKATEKELNSKGA